MNRTHLLQVIQQFKSQKIMVIGDLMLDQYTWGNVNRISPEAPIPILRVEKEEKRLGGAGSVIANVKALDCEVFPIGIIGDDFSGKELLQMIEKQDISTQGILVIPDFQTIVKNRCLAEQQQLLRIDYETPYFLSESIQEKIIQKIKHLLPLVNGVILSDYQKGVLNTRICRVAIELAKKYAIPIVCDPGKGVNFSDYKGITTLKPNRNEAQIITNKTVDDFSQILQAAEKIQSQCEAEFLSISLDKDGILLYENAEKYHLFATDAKEIFDVTGAGDMVISILGILLASGEKKEIAVQMANIAAGIEISHIGVVPLSWEQIQLHLESHQIFQKIVTLEQFREYQSNLSSKKFVFTNGYFDNFSAGHLRFLQEMEQFPGEKIVAINSDLSILKNKGKKPLLHETDRARLLASISSISWIIIFDHDNASQLIETIQPEVIVKGEKFRNQILPEQSAIEKVNASIEYLQFFPPN